MSPNGLVDSIASSIVFSESSHADSNQFEFVFGPQAPQLLVHHCIGCLVLLESHHAVDKEFVVRAETYFGQCGPSGWIQPRVALACDYLRVFQEENFVGHQCESFTNDKGTCRQPFSCLN